MSSARTRLLLRLDTAMARLSALAAAPTPGGFTAADPASGERWEAGQVWAHLGEFVPYWLAQARTVVAARSAEPVPFGRTKSDPARIAAIERDRGAGAVVSLERLRGQVAELRAWLEGLDDAAWEAHGRHPTLGVMDLDELLDEFLVGHLEEHAEQLEGLRHRHGEGGSTG